MPRSPPVGACLSDFAAADVDIVGSVDGGSFAVALGHLIEWEPRRANMDIDHAESANCAAGEVGLQHDAMIVRVAAGRRHVRIEVDGRLSGRGERR